MKLDDTTLPGASMTTIDGGKKLTVYPFLFTIQNAVLEAGENALTIVVTGRCESAAERIAVVAIARATGVKKLKHPSEIGKTDDHYYNVTTDKARWSSSNPANPGYWRYEIQCIAGDPTLYQTSDDAPAE